MSHVMICVVVLAISIVALVVSLFMLLVGGTCNSKHSDAPWIVFSITKMTAVLAAIGVVITLVLK